MYRFLLAFAIILLFSSCNSDDGGGEVIDPYYQNVLTDLNPEDIMDRWTVSQVTYQGESVYIEPEYETCGFDFFDLLEAGVYQEYVFLSYNCNFQRNDYTWTLNNGLLRILNDAGEYDEYAITALNDNHMKANFKADVDEDGIEDLIKVTFIRYNSPSQGDFYNINFNRSDDRSKIELEWDAYNGFNQFTKYQLLRKENCGDSNAEIIAEINNVNTTTFFDANPPVTDVICYQLKVFTNNAEDIVTPTVYVHTNDLSVGSIENLNGYGEANRIYLNWETNIVGHYFSHYEIRRDSNINSSSVYTVLDSIADYNVTTYNTASAFFKEQYYSLLEVDIFGNKSGVYDNRIMIDYARSEMIPNGSSRAYVIDSNEPYMYYVGSNVLNKYNFETQEIEQTSYYGYDSSLRDIRLNESDTGKELIVHTSMQFDVFDTNNLSHKFSYNPDEIFAMDSYELNGNDLVITDYDNIYKFYRQDNDFYFINERPHFPDHQGIYSYMVKRINDSYVVGHRNESQGLLYNVENLELQEREYIDMPIETHHYQNILYSENQNYFITSESGKIYNATTFEIIYQLPEDVEATGISNDGNQIYCTRNVNDIYNETENEKGIVIYQYPSMTSSEFSTIGYPKNIFENEQGEVYSLSTGFNGGNTDLFIEPIN